MKKLESCKKRIVSPTPWYVKLLQALSAAIASIPVYITALPQSFQDSIPSDMLKWFTIVGVIVTFLLQLINKK